MDKKILPFKDQEEIIRCMEKEIQQQKKVIQTQDGIIRSLKNQISILEKQKQRLAEAGNQLFEKNVELDNICMRQQELLEEFSQIFSDIPLGS